MPLNEKPFRRMDLLPLDERIALNQALNNGKPQEYWYKIAALYVRGKTVLDVGAGTGYGEAILREGGALDVRCIDPLPAGPNVAKALVEDWPGPFVDWALAIDVIEHIEDDHAFLRHLLCVAREGVFISTPNWNRFKCQNEFHCREYTPEELRGLLGDRWCDFWAGDDWPALHPPWLVDDPQRAPANFGVAIWNRGRSNHGGLEVEAPRPPFNLSFDYWDGLDDPGAFLRDDRDNPVRAWVAAHLAGLCTNGPVDLMEIGPGSGLDYIEHLSKIPYLRYHALEGSVTLCDHLEQTRPEMLIDVGSFIDLEPFSYDIIYTKATLEHQPDFADPLLRMIAAARREVILVWYRPPAEEPIKSFDEQQKVHYNTYRRADVEAVIASTGASLEVHDMAEGGNSVYIIKLKGA